MLKTKLLPQILGQALGPSIKDVLIVTLDGDLLASTGKDPSSETFTGAIIVNIWNGYFKQSESLGCLIVDNDNGKLAVTRLSKMFLLCISGDAKANPGMIKAKLEKLRNHLEKDFEAIVQELPKSEEK